MILSTFNHTIHINSPDNRDIKCSLENPMRYGLGRHSITDFDKAVHLDTWHPMTFYSLDKTPNQNATFRATAVFHPGEPAQLTKFGYHLRRQTLESGLFANQFTSLYDSVLRLGVVRDEPMIIGGKLLPSGQLVNATGIAIELLELLREKFQFRYEIYPPLDGQYGMSTNEEWTGLIGDLLRGRIDVVVSPLTITSTRLKAVKFIGRIMEDDLGILLSYTRNSSSFFCIFQPFRYYIWLMFLFSMLIGGGLAYAINQYSPFGASTVSSSENTLSPASLCCNLWSSTLSLLQGHGFQIVASSARTVLLSFWTLTLLACVFWQADMTAQLTRDQQTFPFKSLRGILAQTRISPLLVKGTAAFSAFKDADSNSLLGKIYTRSKEREVERYTDAIDLVLNSSNYAIIGDRNLLNYAAIKHCDKLILTRRLMKHGGLAFATLVNRSFATGFSRFLFQLREKGVVDRVRHKWDYGHRQCSLRDSIYRPISVWHTMGPIILLLAFICCSIMVFVVETTGLYMLRQSRTTEAQNGITVSTSPQSEITTSASVHGEVVVTEKSE